MSYWLACDYSYVRRCMMHKISIRAQCIAEISFFPLGCCFWSCTMYDVRIAYSDGGNSGKPYCNISQSSKFDKKWDESFSITPNTSYRRIRRGKIRHLTVQLRKLPRSFGYDALPYVDCEKPVFTLCTMTGSLFAFRALTYR